MGYRISRMVLIELGLGLEAGGVGTALLQIDFVVVVVAGRAAELAE